jgi:putative transposase
MSKFLITIAPGSKIESGGRRYVITHLLDLEAVLAKNEETGGIERLYIKDISLITKKDKLENEPLPKQELILISDEDWQEAQRRFTHIRPLLNVQRRTRKMVNEVARALNLHPATVYRLINAYERMGRISALIPPKRDGGRGRTRLKPEVEKIISDAIQGFYLKKQQRGMEQTCKEVARLCRNAGLEPPHDNTVRNRITALTNRQRVERRRGNKAAIEQFGPSINHFPGADYPLAVIQIDHTPLDIIVVDDIYRRSVGRPWLALAIDVFSRLVVGFYVSLDPPDAMSVGLCIAHAILPKEIWLARRNITTSWPCWGLPRTIHADNAKVFRGNMLKRACEEYGIDLTWRPVATPHWGGHIERYLGTLLKEIHSLPGTTFSNTRERGEYDSEKESAMTLSELETWLAEYITGIYHQRVHSALKMSPIRKYEEGIFGTKDKPGTGLPARITDEDRLRIDFMPYIERTIQTYGVVIDEIHYYHDVLRRFINATDPDNPKLKRQFIFKRDPRNISRIYFFDPELRQYFAIPYRDISHPAISIWELREVRRQLEKEGRENVNEQLIFDTYERMRQQEEEAVRKTKRVRRASQRRSDNQQATNPKTATDNQPQYTDHAQQSTFVTDIKPFDEMEELD